MMLDGAWLETIEDFTRHEEPRRRARLLKVAYVLHRICESLGDRASEPASTPFFKGSHELEHDGLRILSLRAVNGEHLGVIVRQHQRTAAPGAPQLPVLMAVSAVGEDGAPTNGGASITFNDGPWVDRLLASAIAQVAPGLTGGNV